MSFEYMINDKEGLLEARMFGSTMYNALTDMSDVDLIAIYKSGREYRETHDGNLNIHEMSADRYQELLDEHDIMAMETHFYELLTGNSSHFEFTLNKEKLRRKISATVSNSWVKAKKKMLQGDDYVGRKSMWHSIRILMFGIQIAKDGQIYDFEEANQYFHEIVQSKTSYEELKDKYKPIMQKLQTNFRILCPKTW